MSFDALAPHYRWMELVLAGNKLQRCRTAFLGPIPHWREILIMGEGNGRFLVECRRMLPEAHVTCVDSSARMLMLAMKRLQKAGLSAARIEFIHADALSWTPPRRGFDLIVTHFFLDCFRPEQLERIVAALAAAASANATWLMADFQVPAAGLWRYRALAIHRLMYAFFRVATRLPARSLAMPDRLLEEHQFTLLERKVSEWGLLHSDRWERNSASQIPTAPAAPSFPS